MAVVGSDASAAFEIIKLVEDSAGYNINYLTFASSTSSATFINCGGSAASPYVADIDFSGGTEAATTNAIDTSLLTSPIPPQAVLQSERYGTCTYTIPGYTPGSSHTIILYFAENYWNAVGQRTFDVTINGAQLLTNFDIFAATGAQYKAIQQSFNSNANSSSQYVITLTIWSTMPRSTASRSTRQHDNSPRHMPEAFVRFVR